ncbi:MAG: cell division protein FtsA [Victivallaceae bacterium]|nr:cell division protein FtsA [Victivallaceae bacterium]
MSRHSHIVSAIELGTSKITALIGESDGDDIRILGRGSVPSAGSVVKGEIQDMDKLQQLLETAIGDIGQNELFSESAAVVVLVTGCGIDAQPGVGNATIRNSEHIVTEAEVRAANEDAKVLNLASDREIINSTEIYSLIDDRQVSKPLGQSANKLESYVLIVHAISSRVENFRRAVANVGFDIGKIFAVFSPLAADIGILSDSERGNGVLLVDLGAGCTEYVLDYDHGTYASGMLQVGFDHVVNDLSLAFNLHFDLCKKLILSGALEQAIANHQEFMEFRNVSGAIRQIPVSDFITVIDSRLQEIFSIIRQKLIAAKAPQSLSAGGSLTGGGAKFSRSEENFRKIFGIGCQVRFPADAGGAVTGIDDPAFSAVWGGLKVAASYASQWKGKDESWLERFNRKLSKIPGAGLFGDVFGGKR